MVDSFVSKQIAFCSRKHYPVYMPLSGYCPHCGADIAFEHKKIGLDGSESLVTYCPICHKSFCD